MISLRKSLIVLSAASFSLGMAACSKKNTELETDYATKKASAETLMGQITSAMGGMKTDHDAWMKTLTDAAGKPGADTAKINSLKSDLTKHEGDMAAINALEDSVKAYMNASPDNADAFKNADDRLGSNFNDLNDKWKAYQDKHADLQKNIGALAVNTAGNEMQKDSMKAKAEVKKPVKEAPKAAAKEAPVPPAEQHKHPGVQRGSAH